MSRGRATLRLFEIALVFVRLDHVAGRIVNANYRDAGNRLVPCARYARAQGNMGNRDAMFFRLDRPLAGVYLFK